MKPPRKQESQRRKYRPGTVKRILKATEELKEGKGERVPADPEEFRKWLSS